MRPQGTAGGASRRVADGPTGGGTRCQAHAAGRGLQGGRQGALPLGLTLFCRSSISPETDQYQVLTNGYPCFLWILIEEYANLTSTHQQMGGYKEIS